MLAACSRLIRNDSGVTVIEYAFIASLIALAIAGVLGTVGGSLTDTFTTVASNF